MNSAAERAFDGPAGDLLLTIHPLLHVLRGDKRARLQRAFIATVFDMASRALGTDPSHLPPNPQRAAHALHRAVIQLCLVAGVERVELVENYNDHALPEGRTDLGEAIERCLALLSLFHARSIEAP
ncbi:MAG: hypothetical protein ACREHF_02000 [Rhizomicrobium sp.]